MTKQNFEATQGLLEDDVRRQAGSIEKSWLEAVMNSVDAGASKVEITISEDETVIVDDGSGMTEEDIDKYFRQFGYKDEDVEGKTFGKFRRGRGQIFNFGINLWHTQDNLLVVNVEDEETELEGVPLDKEAADDDVEGWTPESEIEEDGDWYYFNTEGLSYNHQKATEHFDGTKIIVKHFKNLDSVSEKVQELRKLVRYISWMHDIEVEVNGEKIEVDFDPEYETEEAYFQFGDSGYFPDAAIYNLGAYVGDFKISDRNNNRVPLSGVVVSKTELQVNNARNDIIEGDPVWETIQEDYVSFAKKEISEKNDELSKKEKRWIIQQCQDDRHLYQEIKPKPLLKDVNGDPVSLEELEESKFSFAPEGNAVAREVMDRKSIIMVDETFEDAVRSLPHAKDAEEYNDVVDKSFNFEMKERSEDSLSKRRKDNLQKIRWFLREIDCYDDVKPGFSKHENVWKDDQDTIFIDEDFLNKKKNVFVTTILDRVVEIAAHDGDTRREINKNRTYYRNYHRYMQKADIPRRKLIEGNWESPDDRTFH